MNNYFKKLFGKKNKPPISEPTDVKFLASVRIVNGQLTGIPKEWEEILKKNNITY